MHTDREYAPKGKLLEEDLTEQVLAAAFKVHNTLGCGFLEKVYENAMVVELSRAGIAVEQQKTIQVKYDGVIVGDYQADLIVEGRVLLECKAVSQLDPVHEAQLLNYLRATGIRVGLLLNFGRTKLHHRRLVF
ncbi:MAG: GxxExxY protein [Candidatus Acidiferrales bacterium]